MPYAEAIATISAILQVADLYATHGDSPQSNLTVLNLQSTERSLQHRAELIASLLPRQYEKLFDAVKEQALLCVESTTESIKGKDLLPAERSRLGAQLRACICREISILRDAMVTDLPAELKEMWNLHRCQP